MTSHSCNAVCIQRLHSPRRATAPRERRVRSAVDESAHAPHVAFGDRRHERTESLALTRVGEVDLCSVLEKEPHRAFVAPLRSRHEVRVPGAIDLVDVCTMIDERSSAIEQLALIAVVHVRRALSNDEALHQGGREAADSILRIH